MQSKANILLVDDHLSNLMVLEEILAPLGQNLVRASSGEEALLHLLEQEFVVILLDIQMGNMDGFETADLIKQRERSKSIPIIFITAIHRDEQHVFRGYATGAVDYLFKPIVPEVLRAKVSVFIDLYRKNAEIQQKTLQLEITNQEVEQQLNQVQILNRKLEAVNLELESFSYSVSHDLRAPLRSIKGFSQALARNYNAKLDDDGQDFLKRIIESCEQMGSLIDDLLQLSRVIRGTMNFQEVNLSLMAAEILSQFHKSHPDRELNIIIEDGLRVKGDMRLLRVVLDNLLNNALKFSRYRSPAVIEMGAEPQEKGTVFFVRDNGAGF